MDTKKQIDICVEVKNKKLYVTSMAVKGPIELEDMSYHFTEIEGKVESMDDLGVTEYKGVNTEGPEFAKGVHYVINRML